MHSVALEPSIFLLQWIIFNSVPFVSNFGSRLSGPCLWSLHHQCHVCVRLCPTLGEISSLHPAYLLSLQEHAPFCVLLSGSVRPTTCWREVMEIEAPGTHRCLNISSLKTTGRRPHFKLSSLRWDSLRQYLCFTLYHQISSPILSIELSICFHSELSPT